MSCLNLLFVIPKIQLNKSVLIRLATVFSILILFIYRCICFILYGLQSCTTGCDNNMYVCVSLHSRYQCYQCLSDYRLTHPLLIVNSTLIDYWNGFNTIFLMLPLLSVFSGYHLTQSLLIVNLALINYWYCCIQPCLPLLYNWWGHLIVNNAISVNQVLILPILFWSLTQPLSVTEIAVHNRGLSLLYNWLWGHLTTVTNAISVFKFIILPIPSISWWVFRTANPLTHWFHHQPLCYNRPPLVLTRGAFCLLPNQVKCLA